MIQLDVYTGNVIGEVSILTLEAKLENIGNDILSKNAAFSDAKYPLLSKFVKENPNTVHCTHRGTGKVVRFDLNKKKSGKNRVYLRELCGYHWRVSTPEQAEKQLQEEHDFLEALRIKTEKQLELETLRAQNLAMETLAKTVASLPQKEETKKGK